MTIKNRQLRKLMEVDAPREADGERHIPTIHDLDNSEYNPANDAFIGMLKALQERMTKSAKLLRPSHLAIAKLADQGYRNNQIALQVRVTPSTVSTVLRREDVMDIRDAMQQYSALIAGSTQAQRDNMLYRIAVRNEISDPKVAISAMAELTKTEHNARVHQLNKKQGGNSSQTVVVQIADSRLQPSKLDEAPAHLLKDVN